MRRDEKEEKGMMISRGGGGGSPPSEFNDPFLMDKKKGPFHSYSF